MRMNHPELALQIESVEPIMQPPSRQPKSRGLYGEIKSSESFAGGAAGSLTST